LGALTARLGAAALVAALVGAATSAEAARFATRLFALTGDYYSVVDTDGLIEMRDSGRPCARCAATLDFERRIASFKGAQCEITRQFRMINPPPGLHDTVVTRVGPNLYAVDDGNYVFRTPRCDVDARAMQARIVVNPPARRLLFHAPDHPNASITGRVTCAFSRAYVELGF
jgi:hypothetical protein